MTSQPSPAPQDDIDRTIGQAVAFEAELSPTEQTEAHDACRLAEQDLRLHINEREYESLLRYILFTIAVIGAFLIVLSNLASVVENKAKGEFASDTTDGNSKTESQSVAISDALLGLGIELLAGAGLVVAISACIKKDREERRLSTAKKPKWSWKWPFPWLHYWLLSEPTLIFGCLGIGFCLSVIPCFCNSTWNCRLLQSTGIELLGGGVLITLFENLERKFKSR